MPPEASRSYACTMDDHLGLDSISFESFDWAPASGDVGSRSWRGKEVVLSEHFFPFPPDLPSLDLEELRLVYEGTGRCSDQPLRRKRRFLRSAPASSDPVRTTKVIELAVVWGTSLPIVRVVLRVPLPDRYAFVASLTLPLAECSWVVKVQAVDPDTTGARRSHWTPFSGATLPAVTSATTGRPRRRSRKQWPASIPTSPAGTASSTTR